jgi:hypothetical protein
MPLCVDNKELGSMLRVSDVSLVEFSFNSSLPLEDENSRIIPIIDSFFDA